MNLLNVAVLAAWLVIVLLARPTVHLLADLLRDLTESSEPDADLFEPWCLHRDTVYVRVGGFGLVCRDCAELLGARP